MNGLVLTYVGDAIYEIYVHDYLIDQREAKPNKLHRVTTNYVSANTQTSLIQQILEEYLLTEEEELYYRRGRNAKNYASTKDADATTYRVVTGFEALMGYPYLTKQIEWIKELIC